MKYIEFVLKFITCSCCGQSKSSHALVTAKHVLRRISNSFVIWLCPIIVSEISLNDTKNVDGKNFTINYYIGET